MTNIEAMEVVVNVGLDGQLSPNTVTTSHMGHIYQWFLCPEGTSKGGPTKNMFKIRPRGKYPQQRFPYIPLASRRFRHHKKEQLKIKSEGVKSFFREVVGTLKNASKKEGKTGGDERKGRSARIHEWKKVKEKLQEKRLRLLTSQNARQEDSFPYDISPSLSSSSEEEKRGKEDDASKSEERRRKKAESRNLNINRWSNLCEEMRESKGNFSHHRSQSMADKGVFAGKELKFSVHESEQCQEKMLEETSKERGNNLFEDASTALSSEKQSSCKVSDRKNLHYMTKRLGKIGTPNNETDHKAPFSPSVDSALIKERSRTSSPVHLRPRKLGSSSSDLVTLGVAESRPVHRNRRSVTFLANLASRMTHLKQEVRDEPTCECIPWRDSLKRAEFDQCSKGFRTNSDEGRDKLDRYRTKDLVSHPVRNLERTRLCTVIGEQAKSYRSLDDNATLESCGRGIETIIESESTVSANRQISASDKCSSHSNTATLKTSSLRYSNHFKSGRSTMTDGVSVSFDQAGRKGGVCDHLAGALALARGAKVSGEKDLPKNTSEMYFPETQSVAGVLTKKCRNGRTVETFLFNPYWLSASKNQSRKCLDRIPKTPEKSCIEIPARSSVEICSPSGEMCHGESLEVDSLLNSIPRGKVWRSLQKVDAEKSIRKPHRQSSVIAKCFARIHPNANPDNSRKAAVYDYCADSAKRGAALKRRGDSVDAKKNRRNNLLFSERILIHSSRRCQRTCKTDIVGCSHNRKRN